MARKSTRTHAVATGALPGDEPGRVIVVDDEAHIRQILKSILEGEGHTVHATDDGNDVLRMVAREPWDVVITDIRMPKMHGHDLLKALQDIDNRPYVLVITAYSTWDDAVEAMRLGAHDYIRKPFDNDHIRAIVAQAVQRRRITVRLATEGVEKFNLGNMIGNSAAMQQVIQMVQRAAPTDSTILIRGESGTGKELVARAIHYMSARAHEPFIPVNCGAFTESLLESELFGHVRGAFTGAVADKKGLLQIADRGTFFLDEVAEMLPATQVKFLRVLENREFKPVGDVKTVSVDVRFITATNQDLERRVKEGRFREDLYYRLNVIPVEIPPLRERRDDIPLLIGHFMALYSRRMGKTVRGVDEVAMEILKNDDWPGNVRELQNMIERAVALTDGESITEEDIVGRLLQAPPGDQALDRLVRLLRKGPLGLEGEGINLNGMLEEVERTYIKRALRTTGGNLTRAAELLGIPFRSIRYRIKKLGIERPGATGAGKE